MPNRENPYQPPTASERLPRNTRVNWKQFGWLNISIGAALVVWVLASFLWAQYEQYQVEQQLGRRYASYDHEYEHHFYPMNGLILLALVFAIPNLALLIVQFRCCVHARQ